MYQAGQAIEVRKATHDGYIWVHATVIRDLGWKVRVELPHCEYEVEKERTREPNRTTNPSGTTDR